MKSKVYERFGTPSDRQSLSYDGEHLEDGKRLNFYKISNESTLFLVLRVSSSAKTGQGEITQSSEDDDTDDSGNKGDESFQIFVKVIDGTTKTFDVKETDFIEDLKEKVFEKIGIPSDEQRLIYGGRQLVNGKCLKSCNISKWSMIHLALRLC